MIRRRPFVLAAAAVSIAAGVSGAGRSSAARVYRVGVLAINPISFAPDWREFVDELSRRGYSEGRNVLFEGHPGAEGADLDVRARKLVALDPDVIVANGTDCALAAKRASRTIPIVFFGSLDPVGSGLVASLSHPGGNLTGSATGVLETFTKSLQYMKDLLGKLTRVVQLQPLTARSLAWFPAWSAAATAAAQSLGAEYRYLDFASLSELEQALARAARERADAVTFIGTDESEHIAALCVHHRLPSIGNPELGFMLEYTPQPLQAARRSAVYVDKILRGTRPAQLPVEMPSLFKLVVNQKTADALGIKIPASMLLRVDRVIR